VKRRNCFPPLVGGMAFVMCCCKHQRPVASVSSGTLEDFLKSKGTLLAVEEASSRQEDPFDFSPSKDSLVVWWERFSRALRVVGGPTEKLAIRGRLRLTFDDGGKVEITHWGDDWWSSQEIWFREGSK
jgi:hypothetical protein